MAYNVVSLRRSAQFHQDMPSQIQCLSEASFGFAGIDWHGIDSFEDKRTELCAMYGASE